MIFFHRWLDKYNRIKLQDINFQFDNYSEFQNAISDTLYPRALLWPISYENRYVTHSLVCPLLFTRFNWSVSICLLPIV